MEKQVNVKGSKTINEIIKDERNRKITGLLKKEVLRLICRNEHNGHTGRSTGKSSIDNNIIDFLHNPIVNGYSTHIQNYYNLNTYNLHTQRKVCFYGNEHKKNSLSLKLTKSENRRGKLTKLFTNSIQQTIDNETSSCAKHSVVNRLVLPQLKGFKYKDVNKSKHNEWINNSSSKKKVVVSKGLITNHVLKFALGKGSSMDDSDSESLIKSNKRYIQQQQQSKEQMDIRLKKSYYRKNYSLKDIFYCDN